MMSRLTLGLRQWYGLELLGPLAGPDGQTDTWTGATPIFVTAVTPLKTGGSMIELSFVRVIAALRPTLTTLMLKVLYRGEQVIVASGEGWRGCIDLFAITPIDMDWLERRCPRLTARYYPVSSYELTGLKPSDSPRVFLEAHFGSTDEAITHDWREDEYPMPLLPMSTASAQMAFERRYNGLDAWLLLRPFSQKWLTYPYFHGDGGTLYIRRRAASNLYYELPFRIEGSGIVIDTALVSLDERQRFFGAPRDEATIIDWIIDSFLLAQWREPPKTDYANRAAARRAWARIVKAEGLTPPERRPDATGSGRAGDGGSPPAASYPDWTDYGIDGTPFGPKLNSYPLHTAEWREAFLDRLGEVGYDVLLEATSRVWGLLERPKAARALAIAIAAGAGGKGKKAIWNTLSRFIDEYVATFSLEKPVIKPPGDIDAVHKAFMAQWAAEAEQRVELVKRYAALLGGEAPQLTIMTTPTGSIIKGPWLATREAPADLRQKEKE